MALIYKIAGVDVTNLIQSRSVSFQTQLETRSDFVSLIAEDDDNNFDPRAGQELIILRDAVRIFGGIIATPKRLFLAPGKDAFRIRAQDFMKLTEKRLVTAAFVTQFAGDIFKLILTNFVLDGSITTVNVQDGPIIDFIGFNFADARLALNEVARRAGMSWYIDENKDVHLFTPQTKLAPFNLDENENRFRRLEIKPNLTQIKNRVTVRGGTAPSASFFEDTKGDTKRRTYPVSYSPTATPAVSVQTGGGGFVPKTVGIKNVDDGTVEFLFDPNRLVIENDTEPTLTASMTLRRTYSFKIPILVRLENVTSISDIAAIEDSDGVYEDVIEDESIETNAAARERAQEELDRFSRELFSGSFETFVNGFRAGQFITASFPDRNINVSAVIFRVTLVVQAPGAEFFKVEFGSFSNTFVDFLLSLHDKGKQIAIREGEVIDDLEVIQEQLPLQDAIANITIGNPPFLWGPSGNTLIWDLGQWG